MKNSGWILWILLILMAALAGAFSENKKGGESRVYRLISERTVSGTVDWISSNRISVRTDSGALQLFKVDTSRQPAFGAKSIAKGDRIVLSYDRNSYQAIDINKTNGDGLVFHPVFLSNPPANRMRMRIAQTKTD